MLLLRIAGQTTRPIGLKFFVDTQFCLLLARKIEIFFLQIFCFKYVCEIWDQFNFILHCNNIQLIQHYSNVYS